MKVCFFKLEWLYLIDGVISTLNLKKKDPNLSQTSSRKQMYVTAAKYWLPAIIWMSIIFYMSTGMFSSENTSRIIVPILNFLFPWLPSHQINLIHGLIRKAGHVTEYFVLGLLLFNAFRGDSIEKWCLRWAIYTILGVVLYAVSDEYHQSFIISRTASFVDIGIDSMGGLLSQAAIIVRWKTTRQNMVINGQR
jgi:VanZ family protein